MAKQINYILKKPASANTTYADISMGEKTLMLSDLTKTFYKQLEASNYDDSTREVLFQQDKAFNKHLSAPKRGTNNCLVSFMSGLLSQHHNTPGKDISIKMLEGITLASKIFAHIDATNTVYEFVEVNPKVDNQADAYTRLFS